MAAQIGSDRPLEIGETLKETRHRRGIDVTTVVEQTKIRAKYIRALEEEDWAVLPGPAYTRGFLRAYAVMLGLDAEVLVDEYQRRHAERAESYGFVEPVLRDRLPEEGTPGRARRGAAIGALVAGALVVILVVIGVTGDGDEEEGAKRGGGKAAKQGGMAPGASPGGELPDTATVRLVARTDSQVCLVDADGNVRIADQLLTAGTEEGPYVSDRFSLKLGTGDLSVFVNAEKQPIPTAFEPVSYTVTPAGLKQLTFKPGCP